MKYNKDRGSCSECGEGYDKEEWLYNTECELCGHPIPEGLIVKRPIYSKEEIEKRLKDMLHEMLRGYNQEDSILSFKYDEENEKCNIEMTVHIVEEDDYIGFGCY